MHILRLNRCNSLKYQLLFIRKFENEYIIYAIGKTEYICYIVQLLNYIQRECILPVINSPVFKDNVIQIWLIFTVAHIKSIDKLHLYQKKHSPLKYLVEAQKPVENYLRQSSCLLVLVPVDAFLTFYFTKKLVSYSKQPLKKMTHLCYI